MTSYRIYRIIKKYSYFSEGGPYLLSFPTCKKAMWVTWYWNFVQGLFYNRNDAVFAIRFSIVSFAINFISNDSFKGFNDLTSEPDRNKAPFSGMVRCCKMWQNENFNLKRSRKTCQSSYFSLPLKLNFYKILQIVKKFNTTIWQKYDNMWQMWENIRSNGSPLLFAHTTIVPNEKFWYLYLKIV